MNSTCHYEPLKVSIITPVLNRRDMLAEAIQSVIEQEYNNIEHIIVDGGSTDGTRELVERYPDVTLIDDPGNLYAAINAGIAQSTGEVIVHLNSDDWLPTGALHKTMQVFEKHPEIDAIQGHPRFFLNDRDPSQELVNRLGSRGPFWELKTLTRGVPSINAIYIRRRVYEAIGDYDVTFNITADREWMLRAWRANVLVSELNVYTYDYREHGESLTINKTGANTHKMCDECMRIIEKHEKNELDKESKKFYDLWRKKIILTQIKNDLTNKNRAINLHAILEDLVDNPLGVFRYIFILGERVFSRNHLS